MRQTPETESRGLLLEPWALGDAIIAARVAHAANAANAGRARWGVACSDRWRPILAETFPGLPLGIADPGYTRRGGGRWPSAADRRAGVRPPEGFEGVDVWSARGDPRDAWLAWSAARRTGARARVSGFAGFVARREGVADAVVRRGGEPRNRYDRWSDAIGVARLPRTSIGPARGTVAIHVGAQWGSKRYPGWTELAAGLAAAGWPVRWLRGPGDEVPAGGGSEVVGVELVSALRGAAAVFANDSGPAHLAAALGRPTWVVYGNDGASEWGPPGARCLTEIPAPERYRPRYDYATDLATPRWPSAARILGDFLSAHGNPG